MVTPTELGPCDAQWQKLGLRLWDSWAIGGAIIGQFIYGY
jgi:hypothetical protein